MGPVSADRALLCIFREPRVKYSFLALASCLATMPAVSLAEDNGEELLAMMQAEQTREVSQTFIDAVWQKLDGVLFCLEEHDRAQKAFSAVRNYLESNPAEQYRPRRYLIIQALRQAYPCPQR